MEKGTGLKAAADWRGLLMLAGGAGAAFALASPFPAFVGAGCYMAVAAWIASAPTRRARAARARLARELHLLRVEIAKAHKAVLADIPWYNFMERPWRERAGRVVKLSEELFQEWPAHPADAELRFETVHEGLQLAHTHLRLIVNYRRLAALGRSVDVRSLRIRMTRNQGRLLVARDPGTRQELNRALELDEQVIRQAEKHELDRERCLALLDGAESNLVMLVRRSNSPDLPETGRRLQDLFEEAEAMDQAVAEVRRRTRVR